MNNISEKRRIKIVVVSILALAVLFGCIGVTLSNGNVALAFQSAVGSSDMTIASNSTNISGDLLSSDTSKLFDKNVFWTLVQQVAGSDKIVSSDTLASYATTNSSLARTSADFRKDNGSDVVVHIDGIPFTATYLTKDSDGNVILTLWQADAVPITYYDSNARTLMQNQVNVEYCVFGQNSLGKYPSNSYGTSFMSTNVLNNGGQYSMATGTLASAATQNANNTYAKFTMSSVSGSIANYIVTPSAMPYQSNATYESAKAQAGIGYDLCNDSLGTPTAGNFYVNASKVEYKYYGNSSVTQGSTSGTAGYLAWGDDKIWLPSMAEAGDIGDGGADSGLWKTSTNQRSTSTSVSGNSVSYSWLRSALYGNYSLSCMLSADGSNWDANNVAYSYAARPAFHLNLTSAGSKAGDLGLDPPQDVSVDVYTGSPQNFSSLTKTPDWYDNDKISVEFADGSTGKIDAGEYDMVATIKPDLVAKGLKFMGTAGAGETDTSRKFKFKIPKKKIAVTLSLNNNVPQVTVAVGVIYSGDTDANGRAPVFDFDYKDRITNKACSGYPTGIVGKYTATVKITNDCNYELDTSTTLTIDFDIKRTEVEKPSIATTEKDYTGKDITFNLSQYSDKVSVTITSANGKTATHSNGVITVRDVDTYTVRIALKDNGVSTCWKPPAGQTPANDDINAFTIPIKVKQKELTPTITCSDADASWDAGDTPTMTITDDRLSDANGNKDNIDYYVYYMKSGDNTKYDYIDASKQVTANGIEITMPSDLAIGSYTFVVELRKNSSSSHNGNYYIDGDSKELQFAVVGKGISVTPDKIKWKVNNADIGQLTNGKLLLTYNGKAFKFSIDESNLQSMGVKIDTTKGTNRGYEGDIEKTDANTLYRVTVWLCNYDNTVTTYSGSFSLHYDIQQAKYDMSKVKWNYTDGALKYNGNMQSVVLTIPSEAPYNALTVQEYDGNSGGNAKSDYIASVLEFNNTDSNYVTPLYQQPDTYEGDFDWSLTWSIGKGELTLEWASTDIGKDFKVLQVTGSNAQYVDASKYKYYKSNGASVGDAISLDDIVVGDSSARYWVEAVLTDNAALNYEITEASKRKSFKVGSDNEKITVELSASSFTYDGNAHGGELRVTTGVLDISRIIKTYYKGSVSPDNKLDKAPTDAGNYIVVLSLSEEDEEEYALAQSQIPYSIAKAKIKAVWDTSGQIPTISNLSETQKQVVGYIYYDADGNQLPDGAQLEAGKSYKVKAILTGANVNNYEFVSESGEVLPSATQTQEEEFTVKANGGLGNNVGIGGDGESFNEIWQKLKGMPLWQIIASIISIILTIIFLTKTASYDNKRKKFNKKADKLSGAYAGAYLGIATTIWTAIACVLMGLAIISLVMMLIAKSKCDKAEEEYEDQLEEYNRNQKELDERKRDESMRMMLMGMMGSNANGQSFGFAGQGVSADEMRIMINDAVTAMLPNVQQYLPQPTANNDESIKQIIKTQEELAHNQDLLMKKLAEQPTEKVIEKVFAREVASANANDETIKSIIEGQKTILQRLDDLSAKQNAEPQVVEKIVEKEVTVEVPVEVEKIVEKEVVKEVPIEVEKVVEKEVIKEVPIEVEKIIEKEVVKEVKVEVPVVAPSKPKKEVAPRLSLDEAFAKLSKQQQKYFEGLKQYAMSKPKCKEMKSTYFTVLGQSSLNPLVKLTVKKGNVVALFKMEDEITKDLRKDAGSKGTKVKVKETELAVTDAQAFATAKKMIDLREDQIERYNELLKEQRSLRSK